MSENGHPIFVSRLATSANKPDATEPRAATQPSRGSRRDRHAGLRLRSLNRRHRGARGPVSACVVTPQRIQLKRTKGWRKPEGSIVVSRPSKWGNPYKSVTPILSTAGR